MKIALVNLKTREGKANRDHAGGFGSYMHASGWTGQLIATLKENLIELPILGFGFSAAILRNAGHEVNYYEGSTQGEDIIIIASSMHCYRYEVAFAEAEKSKYPLSRVGFFGPFVKACPHFFEGIADFMIFGEIESTLFAFLEGNCSFENILDHGTVKDLSTLPPCDWRGLNIRKFSYFPLLHKRPFLSISSSRGCSFDCDFCPYIVSQTKFYRRRSPESVVDEMAIQIQRHKIRSFLFRDPLFSIKIKHVEQICGFILNRGLNVEWACETRVDCLNKDLIDIMHKAGLCGINLGIESNNAETQKNTGKKPSSQESQDKIIRYLQSKGIRINAFYMLGLLGDTAQSMKDTINYAKRLNTLGAQFCTLTPFPGTRLFERLKNDLITHDFSRFDEYQPVVNIKTATPQEVESFSKKAYQYYLRPNWIGKHGIPTTCRLIRNFLS